tara:strand:+ start:415 stop:672 length:258 start_codon:yes stop_codon:yes gene_type:complete
LTKISKFDEIIDDTSKDNLLGGYYVFYRRLFFIFAIGGIFMILLSITESYAFSSIFTGLCVGPLFILEDKWVRYKMGKNLIKHSE